MTVPLLLTPGPLTTSASVKVAMARDWGSRDREFIAMNRDLRARLIELVGGSSSHVCVPIQGSGTFAIEATLSTTIARDAKLLVLVNGAYGRRMVEMMRIMQREVVSLEWPEDEAVDVALLDDRLGRDPSISHVAVVHCETTTGILNPLSAVAWTVAKHGRRLIVDAMSTFGALPIDVNDVAIDAVVASSNKCLEGVPGLGFALIRRDLLEHCASNAQSLSLDLHAQWRGFEANDQWRFTPPTNVVAALDQGLRELADEGGVTGRGARYARNHAVLVAGMESLGFECLIERSIQAPIIVTFLMPADPNFVFENFYDRLGDRGFLIYPGKLTVADSFRIGCIGRIDEHDIRSALSAIAVVLDEMGVRDASPVVQRAAI
jgi:2-aminoethylphosphonate-pyruvate transaminase